MKLDKDFIGVLWKSEIMIQSCFILLHYLRIRLNLYYYI